MNFFDDSVCLDTGQICSVFSASCKDVMRSHFGFKVLTTLEGPRWQSGNTLVSHLKPGFGSQHGLKWESW